MRGGNISLIENIFMLEKEAKKLENANGSEIREFVERVFCAAGQIIEKGNNEEMIATIMIEAGALGLSWLAAGAAVAVLCSSFATGGVTLAAGIAAVVTTGIALYASFATLIVTIFSMVERSMYGVVVNNTPYSLVVENALNDFEDKKKMRGVCMRHGGVGSLMYNKEEVSGEFVNVPGQCTQKDQTVCFVGLFQYKKEISLYGSEGTIRFKHHNDYVDLHAACPLNQDNRMILSSAFKNKNIGDSDSALAKKWKNEQKNGRYEEMNGSIKYTGAVSDLRNSPAYGIATASMG